MPDFGRWNAGGGDPSLNEINRTDQFLDALAAQQHPYSTDRGEAELANLLAGWRDDVRETPMGSVVSTEQAAAALERVTSPARRRRLSLAVVGSTAAAVLCLGGFGAVIAGSNPGDALYGLRTVLFGDQVQTRDEAVVLAAQTEMQQVQRLIEQGDWQGAQAKLEAVTTTVATVGDDERKAELVTQWQELTVKVAAQDPAATPPPGAPLPTFPAIDPNTLTVTIPSGPSESSTTGPSDTSSTSPSESTSATPTSSETSPSETTPSETAPAASSSAAPGTTAASTSATTVPTSTSTVSQQSTSAAPSSAVPSSSAAATPSSTAPKTTTTTAPKATSAAPATTAAPSPTAPETTAAPVEQETPTTTTLPVVPVEPVAPEPMR